MLGAEAVTSFISQSMLHWLPLIAENPRKRPGAPSKIKFLLNVYGGARPEGIRSPVELGVCIAGGRFAGDLEQEGTKETVLVFDEMFFGDELRGYPISWYRNCRGCLRSDGSLPSVDAVFAGSEIAKVNCFDLMADGGRSLLRDQE